MKVLTETDFDKIYTYDETVKSKVFDPESQLGMFETYGVDIKYVMEMDSKHPKKVWTMVDGDDGMYLVSGFHHVNRIYYVITNEDCVGESEEYQIEEYKD